ncbi:MAG: hypothetical protein S0880_25730 [Actinomycetota bacterium]|nr:hypothetical protein [Actinomycetota bacterium]
MTPVEEEISRRLHAAAGRITVMPEAAVELDLEPEDGHSDGYEPAHPVTLLPPPPPTGGRRRLAPLAVAAACLVAVALVGAFLVTDTTDPAATAAPSADLTLTEPVAPWAENPPAWVGELRPASADRDRDGTWVTGSIGIVGDDDTITSPIRISVFDGWERVLDTADEIELDGEPVLEGGENGWRVLATPEQAESPDGAATRVLVSGGADAPLAEVLRGVEIVEGTGGGAATYHLGSMPDGYEEVVAPIVQADLDRERPAIAGADGHVVVYDISEWVDPLLAATLSGAVPVPVETAGLSGWTVDAEPSEWPAPVRSFVWSPEPGVVFEVVSDDPDHTVEMLAELAATVEVQPLDEWQELHDA